MDNSSQQSLPPQPNPPIQAPVTPAITSHKPNMLLIGICAVVLLLIGLGGGYILRGINQTPLPQKTERVAQISQAATQKPSPTVILSPSITQKINGWKTYINEKNGYSLKYPTDTLVRFQCPDEELTIDYKTSSDQRTDGELMPTCARDGRYTIEGKTYTDEYSPPTFDDHYDIKKEDVTFNGISATRYTYSIVKPFLGQSPPDWFQEVLIKKSNKTFEFYLGIKEYQSVFDQILSTIIFTN